MVDADGRVFGALVGQAAGESFQENVVQAATEHMRKAALQVALPEENRVHRRGVFSAATVGISFGGGQTARFQLSTYYFSLLTFTPGTQESAPQQSEHGGIPRSSRDGRLHQPCSIHRP